ncbi:dienelactone hydrolase family protein [Cohnella ginsengisoli]|uniref:Dienelactone hydrolase family protein n=1 Tax=Cohnella ginsengisoli TaxID=425004 RepID=A0A9X4KG74_9BACL|nr:dienelactone hydrolase family protein [Cohnella ginsengisoli]MDG0791410.1 dienelactone hydrolase family protein [Cohnella ginsengisoli]
MSGEKQAHESVASGASTVDHIPLIWERPASGASRDLVVWLPGLTGRKEHVREDLRKFADAGFTAVSYDPYEHGDRMRESMEAFRGKLGSNKRRYFWPMIALTAEEYPRIIDWAFERFGLDGAVLAGGISMGGDIAVTAAGIDRRIRAVAACISTPDWLRPGSDEAPSEPDAYAWNCYRRCNPLTNAALYAHTPAIRFLNGAQDGHVPPDGARRFRESLAETYAASPERFVVTEYEGVGHAYTETMLEDALSWFKAHRSEG